MASAWGKSWAASWGNSWGLLTRGPVGGGGGRGWVLQQFLKRPWEHDELDKKKIVQEAYRELVEYEVPNVRRIVEPYVESQRIDWDALIQNVKAIEAIVLMDIRLKQKMDEDAEEEEALILMLSY